MGDWDDIRIDEDSIGIVLSYTRLCVHCGRRIQWVARDGWWKHTDNGFVGCTDPDEPLTTSAAQTLWRVAEDA